MSAVWMASRAAVKRRRVQTFVIGLVVLCATTTVLLALALLGAASGPFDKAFAEQRGAHAVAGFDAAKVSDAALARTVRAPGVAAAAGPFGQAVVELPDEWLWMSSGALTVVGRADPGGPVDNLRMVLGRWATKPGELVVNWPVQGSPGTDQLGTKLRTPGGPTLTVVGFAVSMSKSASAWVTPEQVKALHPAATQMLYRFDGVPGSNPTGAAAQRDLEAALGRATAGLPTGAMTSAQSSATLKRTFSAQADAYLPFMTLFGVLGLLVSVLIVGNVVSGAVVSGYRHIGVLKSLGFTPRQVVAVYLTMVSVPALAGCLLGTAIGTAAAQPILKIAFSGIETGTAAIGFSWWIPVVCLLAMPALVLLTALVPASRAHRLSAAEAISAGSAPATGRGLRVQRALGGSRLPRAVSMGLGQPFARPARTLLTLSAIVLGVTTVTLTTGLTSTMVAYGKAGGGDGTARLAVEPGSSGNGMTRPRLPAAEVERRLNALPGADGVTVRGLTKARIAGSTGTKYVNFYRGDTRSFGTQLAQGRFPERPGEIAAGPAFLDQQGLQVGDRTTLYLHGKQTAVTVVGQLIESNAQALETTWETVAALDPAVEPADYTVRLSAGTDTDAALAAVTALDPGLHPSLNSPSNTATVTVVSFSTIFTVLLSLVAALGVFNTVLLNIRERQRDLGMLKSIGMTPRQVVLMTVTSVAGIGAVGGLLGIPLGMGAHRWVVDNVGVVAFPAYMKAVWSAPQLAALALAGVTIAVLGALLPARRAARLTIARVLHGE